MLPSCLATYLNYTDQTPFYIAFSLMAYIFYFICNEITLGKQIKDATLQDLNLNIYEKLLKRLSKKNQIAEKAMESYELQVNQMVHELRSPLLVLVSSISLIKSTLKKRSLQQEDLFEVTSNLGEHLIAMINNLMEYSKLKAQKVELNKTSIDVLQNVRNLLKMHYYKAKEKGNALQLFVSNMFPKKVIADEQKIKQIIINLLSNAIKFTNKGVISVYIGWKYEKTKTDENPNEEFKIQYEEDKLLFRKLENPALENDIDTENLSNYDSLSQKTFSQFDFKNIQENGEKTPHSKFKYKKMQNSQKHQQEDAKKNDFGYAYYLNNPNNSNNNSNNLQEINYLTQKTNQAQVQQAIFQDQNTEQQQQNQQQNKSKQLQFKQQNEEENLEMYGIKKQQILPEMGNQEFFQLCDDYLLNSHISNDDVTQKKKKSNDEDIYILSKPASDTQNQQIQNQPYDSQNTSKQASQEVLLTSRSKQIQIQNYMSQYDTHPHDNQMIFPKQEINKKYCNTFIEPANEQLYQEELLIDDQDEFKEDNCKINQLQSSMYHQSPSNIQMNQITSRIKKKKAEQKQSIFYFQVNSPKLQKQITFNKSIPDKNEQSQRQDSNQEKRQSNTDNKNAQLYSQYNYSFQYNVSDKNIFKIKPETFQDKIEQEKDESSYSSKTLNPQDIDNSFNDKEEIKFDFDALLLGNNEQKEIDKERKQSEFTMHNRMYSQNQKNSHMNSSNENDRVPMSAQHQKREDDIEETKQNFSNIYAQRQGNQNFQSQDVEYLKQRNDFANELHKVTAFFPEDLSKNQSHDNSQEVVEQRPPYISTSQQNSLTSDQKINNLIKDTKLESTFKINFKKKLQTQKFQQQINVENYFDKNEFQQKSTNSLEKNIFTNKNSIQTPYDPYKFTRNLRKEEILMHSNTGDYFNQFTNRDSMQFEFQRFQTMNQIKLDNIKNKASTRNEFSVGTLNQLGEKGTLIIEIQDSGIGISNQGLANLFQPFQQEDETIAKNFGGTGLGLSICHNFIEIMNGKIDVQSTKGEGTRFKIEIPMQLSNELNLLVDNEEFDQSHCSNKQFEFLICENRKSYGIQKIKNKIIRATENYQIVGQNEIMNWANNTQKSLFRIQNSMKIFVVDYINICDNKNLLQTLNNQLDEVQINYQEKSSSTNLQKNIFEEQSQIGKQKISSTTQILKFKIPIIVLIKSQTDETLIKKQDNMFMLRIPYEPNSLKKILALVRKYYTSQVIVESVKSQKNHISEEEVEDAKSEFNKSDISYTRSNDLSSYFFYKKTPLNTYFINQHQQQQQNHTYNSSTQQDAYNPTRLQSTLFAMRANSAQVTQLQLQQQQVSNKNKLSINPNFNQLRHNNFLGLLPKKRSSSYVRGESSFDNQYITEEIKSAASSTIGRNKCLRLPNVSMVEQESKIMIVNDDPNVMKVLFMMIDSLKNNIQKNISILRAINGKEAYEMFQQQSNIKCIFMDINMPIMGGIQATQKIRQYEELRKSSGGLEYSQESFKVAYIIGVSGYNDANQTRECTQAGMDEVLYQTPNMENMKIILSKLFQ